MDFDHSALALPLFVFGVFTDHPDYPFAFHNLTLVADFFDRSSNFHCLYPIVEEIGFRLLNPPSPLNQGRGETDCLFLPKNNSPAREIVGGKFYRHLISGEDLDEVHSHLS